MDKATLLKNVDLRFADLAGVDLSNFDLTNTDLRGALLRGTRLVNADLAGTLLQGANLLGADITGAKNLASAVYDSVTTKGFNYLGSIDAKLPKGFGFETGGPQFKLSGGWNAVDKTLQMNFVVDVDRAFETTFSFDSTSMSSKFADLGLSVEGSGALNLGLAFDMDLFFGVQLQNLLTSGLTDNDFYFGGDASIGAGISITNLNLTGTFGDPVGTHLSVGVAGGLVDLDLSGGLAIDGSGDKRVTLQELLDPLATLPIGPTQPSGSLNAILPLTAQAGSFDMSKYGKPIVYLKSDHLVKSNFTLNSPDVSVDFQISDYLRDKILGITGGINGTITKINEGLNVEIPLVGKLNELLNVDELAQFHTLSQEYFNQFTSGIGYPTLSGWLQHALSLDIWGLAGHYDQTTNEFTYHLNFQKHAGTDPLNPKPLDFEFALAKDDADSDASLADVSISTKGSFSADLSIDFILGVDLGVIKNDTPLADAIYLKTSTDSEGNDIPTVSVQAHAEASGINAEARFAFLGVNIEGGYASGDATFTYALKDPDNSDNLKRITLGEFGRAVANAEYDFTGNATASLPIAVPFLGVTAGPDTTVVVTLPDLKDLTNFTFTPEIGDLPGLQDALNFKNMTAGAFVSMLAQASDWLNKMRESGKLDFDIPFVGTAVDKVLDFTDMVRDSFLYDDADDEVDGDDALVTDMNQALMDAGFGTRIVARGNGTNLTLISIDPSITSFTVSVNPADGGGYQQLGFPSAIVPAETRPALMITPPADGKHDKEAVFDVTLTLEGSTAKIKKMVTLAADTANTKVGNDEPKLVQYNNAPTFQTAQQLADRLNLILGFKIYRSGDFNAGSTDIVNVGTDEIRFLGTDGNVRKHGLTDGMALVYEKGTGNTAIDGLTDQKTYYVIKVDEYAFKLANSYSDALAGRQINITGLGSGTTHQLNWDVINYKPETSELDFRLGSLLKYTFEHELPLDFDLDLSPLLELSTETTVKLSAILGFDPAFTLGVYLGDQVPGAQGDLPVDGNVLLSNLNGGEGVDIKTQSAVIAPSEVITRYGELSGDATFTLQITKTDGTYDEATVTVDRSATDGTNALIFDGEAVINTDPESNIISQININGHGLKDGQAVVYTTSGGTAIGGLIDGALYYVVAIEGDVNAFKLARTEDGPEITLTAKGEGGTHAFRWVDSTTFASTDVKYENEKNWIIIGDHPFIEWAGGHLQCRRRYCYRESC